MTVEKGFFTTFSTVGLREKFSAYIYVNNNYYAWWFGEKGVKGQE